MADVVLKKGANLPLVGIPSHAVADAVRPGPVAVDPRDFIGVRPRLRVKEGDTVRRGSPLFCDKGNEDLHFGAPAAGTVASIRRGARRVIEEIRIDPAADDEAVDFGALDEARIQRASRGDILKRLLASGYLAFIRQRPFSGMADPEVKPKSIFVNAMATAPFSTHIAPALKGEEEALQAGIRALGRLTDGPVYLVVSGDDKTMPGSLARVDGAEVRSFRGPHPAGNASVHIHHLDPIVPGDTVWTVRADDLIQIGRLLMEGVLPTTRVIGVGGPAVAEKHRRHYRVRVGGLLEPLCEGVDAEGEVRVLNGDVLSGQAVSPAGFLPFASTGLTVIPEDRGRLLIGWLAPGGDRFSLSRTFLSAWTGRRRPWALGTNRNGGPRAMVLTGLYDKYLPMKIMVDFLVRAVLANDTDEAIKLGILETDPEDFALCAFACPSKMDLVGIMRRGLQLVEEEGL